MRHRNFFLTMTGFIFFAACSEEKLPSISAPTPSPVSGPSIYDQAKEAETEKGIPSELVEATLLLTNPVEKNLLPLRKSCRVAGGSFDENRKECLCSSNQNFASRPENGRLGGICREPNVNYQRGAVNFEKNHIELREVASYERQFEGKQPVKVEISEPGIRELENVRNDDVLEYNSLGDFESKKDGDAGADGLVELLMDLTASTVIPMSASLVDHPNAKTSTVLNVGRGYLPLSWAVFSGHPPFVAQLKTLGIEKEPVEFLSQHEILHYEIHLFEPDQEFVGLALGQDRFERPNFDFFRMPSFDEIITLENKEFAKRRPSYGKDLPEAVWNPMYKSAVYLDMSTDASDWAEGLKIAKKAYDAYLEAWPSYQFRPTEAVSHHILGCAHHCELRMPYGSSAHYAFQFAKRYTRGGVEFESLRIVDTRTEIVVSIIVLNKGGSAGYVLINSLVPDLESDNFSYFSQGLDRELQVKGVDAIRPVDLEIDKAIQIASSKPKTIPNSLSLICDAGYRLTQNNPRQWVGQHRPQVNGTEFSGSLSGFFLNQHGSFLEFISGHEYFDSEVSQPGWGVESHTIDVVNAFESYAKGAPINQSFAVMNLEDCFERYKEWKPEAQRVGLRSVIVPASFNYEKTVCRGRYEESIFRDPDADILWILSSGNVRESLMKTDMCPNSLAVDLDGTHFDPLIVASSNPSGDNDFQSNIETTYADIAAPGNIGDSEGSSFAAPRVGAIAARLLSEFPDFHSSVIRSAIIFGAKIDNRVLPVKAGGVVDEDGARLFLSAVSAYKSDDKKYKKENLIAHLEQGRLSYAAAQILFSFTLCGDRDLKIDNLKDCNAKTKRIEVLKRSKLLSDLPAK